MSDAEEPTTPAEVPAAEQEETQVEAPQVIDAEADAAPAAEPDPAPEEPSALAEPEAELAVAEPAPVEPEPAEPAAAESAPVEAAPTAPDPPPTAPASVPAGAMPVPPGPPPAPPGVVAPPSGAPVPAVPSDAGKIVGGSITAVTEDEIELTLDDGRPAVINRRNFDDAGTAPSEIFSIGDRAEGAILVREDPRKRVVLSRTWAIKKKAWDELAALHESGGTITAPVTGTAKRGVVVDVGLRGFVPASHMALEPMDLSTFVGESLEFKILEIDPAKERLVLSRRSLLLKEQRKTVHDALTSLTVGEIRTGTVTSLVDYGAFVDVGGVTGLVHLSELAWHRVRRAADAVKVGDEVQVKVLDVKVKKRRVSLSIRQLTADPYVEVKAGEVVVGTVTRLVDFGAFVDVGAGEGLVHLSELSEYRVFTPEEVVTPGEEVRVKVLSVDKKRRRIELSIRQAVSSDFG